MNRNDVTETLTNPISQQLLASSIPARLAYVGTDGAPERSRSPSSGPASISS
jgi:hypothetical protein